MLSLKSKHNTYLRETHPSRGRAIAGAATAGQGISPSDYARSLYIAPGNRRNAHNITARENLAASVNKAYIPPQTAALPAGEERYHG